jgi:hypothetical protein
MNAQQAPQGGSSGSVDVQTVDGPSVSALKPKVIKTADVSLGVTTSSFSRAFSEARDIADRFGGFNLDSSTSSTGRDSGSVRFRVPSDSFVPALNALENLSGWGHVRSEHISGQDVTSEYIDLKARRGNLASQRRVLLRLMDRAHTISDSIRIEDQLRSVQLQIEQIKGQLRYLNNETSYATISATISAGVPVAGKPSVLQRAWAQMSSVTSAVVAAILIGGAAATPIAILLLVGLVLYRILRPRISSIRQT